MTLHSVWLVGGSKYTMQSVKTILAVFVLLLLAHLTANSSLCQTRTNSQSISSTLRESAQADAAKDPAAASQPQHPVVIDLKNGDKLRGDLIREDLDDSDSIIVEIAGLRRSIKLDSVIGINSEARKFDEYGNVAYNDEKARLDDFAIELQSNPGESAHIMAYGLCKSAGQERANRAREYLVNTRGIDAGRVVARGAGCRSEFLVELWIVPLGDAQPPIAQTITCPPCKSSKVIKKKSRTHKGKKGGR